MEQFLKIEEVADRLHVHANTVRSWLKNGRFPNSIKIDTVIRIPVSDIEALKQNRPEAS